MKFLIDTNVILDVLLKREPFYSSCVNVLHLKIWAPEEFFEQNRKSIEDL